MNTRLAALALLAALLPSPGQAAEFRTGQAVMGTILQVTVVAEDAEQARRLADDCVREAKRWDGVLTTWRPDGELARLNRRAGEGAVAVSPLLAAAIRKMLTLSHATGGAFDPAVGPWVDWWRTPRSAPREGRVPAMAEVVKMDGDGVSLARGVALDAGGIGKGIAVDAMVRLLRAGGARAAFIDFGGSSLFGLGAPADQPEGWRVAIGGLDEGEIYGTLALRDSSLSTSRSSGSGDPAGPIVDPGSGRPSSVKRLAVVLSPDAAAADAWSTALIVRGPEALVVAATAGVEALVAGPGGTSTTPALTKKIRRGT